MRSAVWALPSFLAVLAGCAATARADDNRTTEGISPREALATARGACAFKTEPQLNYYWDLSCKDGGLGCFADGEHPECRFCGGDGDFASVACPPPTCGFVKEPPIPYFWDPSCTKGKLGCWADGVNAECRFCGKAQYADVKCPTNVGGATAASCKFAAPPSTSYYWDETCVHGMHGCLADQVHLKCRFCGGGKYANVPCPEETVKQRKCTFTGEPDVPTYWEELCAEEGLPGCLADGIHAECRYCGAGAYENITCQTSTTTTISTSQVPAKPAPGQRPNEPRGRSSQRSMDAPPGQAANNSIIELSHAAGGNSRLARCLVLAAVLSLWRI